MVGILLITHNGLGDSLLDCVRHVMGNVPANLASMSVLADDDPALKEQEALLLISKLDTGEGVLMLTDIFGATPSNIAHRMCNPGKVEGVAGVNLPMLLRLVFGPSLPLNEMTQRAIQGGRECIVPLSVASTHCEVMKVN